MILIRGKILQEHYHSKTAKWKINSLSYNFPTIMMASSVISRQRRSFLKILLWAKHTRGFLTNLLLGRKYFLCSNYMGGANNKINIRQFCEKKVRQRYLHHPRVTVKARRQVQVSWQKNKKKAFVLRAWTVGDVHFSRAPPAKYAGDSQKFSQNWSQYGRNSCQCHTQ